MNMEGKKVDALSYTELEKYGFGRLVQPIMTPAVMPQSQCRGAAGRASCARAARAVGRRRAREARSAAFH